MSVELEWWHICIIVFLIFLAFLFTNYILKKINEARIDERLARLLQKTPTSQATQMHETVVNIKPANKNAENAVSLVFDKDDNILPDYKKSRDIYPMKSKNRELEDIKEITEKPDDILSETRQVTDTVLTPATEAIVAQSAENNKTILGSLVIKDSDFDSYTSDSISVISHKITETQSFKINEKLKPIVPNASNVRNQALEMSTITNITETSNKLQNMLQDRLETKRVDIINAGTLVSGIPQKTEVELSSKISNFNTVRHEAKETDAANLNVQVSCVMHKIDNSKTNLPETKETVATNLNIQVPKITQKKEKSISFKIETDSQEAISTVSFNPKIPASIVLEKTNNSKVDLSEKTDTKSQKLDILEKIEYDLPFKIGNFERNRQELKDTTYLNNQAPVVMQESMGTLSFKISNFEKNRQEIKETGAKNLNIQRPDILEKTENGLPCKVSKFEKNINEIKAPDVTNVNSQAEIPCKRSNLKNNGQEIIEKPESSAKIILEKINWSKLEISEKSEATSHESTLIKSDLSSEKEHTQVINQNVNVSEMSQIKGERSSQKNNNLSKSNLPKANDTESVNSDVTNINSQTPGVVQRTEEELPFKKSNLKKNSQGIMEMVTLKSECSASITLENINCSKVENSEKSEATSHKSTLMKNDLSSDKENTQIVNQNVNVPEMSQIKGEKSSQKINNLLKANDTESVNSDVTNVNRQAPDVVQRTKEGIPCKISNLEKNSQGIMGMVALNPKSSASIILEKINCSKVESSEKSEATSHKSTLMKSDLSSDKENNQVVNQNVNVPEMSQIKCETSSQKINNLSKSNLPKANDTKSVTSEVDAP